MSITRVSPTHSHIAARNVVARTITPDDVRFYGVLSNIGINLSDRALERMIEYAMDNNDVGLSPAPLSTLTTPSTVTPVQFLQNWLPGLVRYLTAARMIDELIGVTTIGSWEEEQIVQRALEPAGTAFPYGDYNNVPLTSYNVSYNQRTVVRFELGMLVGVLEEARAARAQVSSSGEKRTNVASGLEIQRNRVGFYGYNDGSGQTYGFLNDPALPAYITATNGASGSPLWSMKTFMEITADIRQMVAGVQVQGMGNINVKKTPMTLGIPLTADQYLSMTTTLGGYSVQKWLEDTYPNIRVVAVPELVDANGGASAAYLFADAVEDGSSDDSKTFVQIVPTKFNTLGVERRSKSYLEDYSNATAGVMVKRPFAVYRLTGI
jgi:hypothetical protein